MNLFKITLSFVIFSLICIFSLPYFTSSFLEIRQQKAEVENRERLLQEEQALKKAREEAVEKIYLTGKFNPEEREDFMQVPKEFNLSPYNIYLRKETLNAFLKMEIAAREEKINLKIASATRNFDYQKNLWNNKWSGYTLVEGKDLSKSIPDGLKRFQKILEYSATPGISRHHWGSDIDINNANLEYFYTKNGKEVYEWLNKNASSFGFCQPYTLKGSMRPTGYNEEKWHWSYLPLARDFTQRYKELIKDEDIKGFLGEEYVTSLDLINDYVLTINPECL